MAGCTWISGQTTRVGRRSKVADAGGMRGSDDDSEDPENVEEGVGGFLGITGKLDSLPHMYSW